MPSPLQLRRLFAQIPCFGYHGYGIEPARPYSPASWGSMERYRTARVSDYHIRPRLVNPTGDTASWGTTQNVAHSIEWVGYH